jgi:fucose 4-O-acetylase-like acetyltransferase
MALPPFLSNKFRFWSFVSMVLLVFVHGYNLHERFLQPWTTPGEPLTFTSFTEYFLANGILRFRIPMLFIISGFLYSMSDHKPYGERTGKRFRTLFLPYLAWSALGMAFIWILECFAPTRDMVISSEVVRIDQSRVLVHDYHWYEALARWILFPVSYQLWFIRVLFIYNLAYPALRWCVTHRIASKIFFPLVFLMWLGTMNFGLIEGEGMLFFSLGIWIQKKGFAVDRPGRWLRPLPWGLVFLVFAAAKTWLAFRGADLLGHALAPVMTLMHKATVLGGLIACWYGLDVAVRFFMEKRWFVWFSAFSFMIYAMHTPLIAVAINPVFSLVNSLPLYRLGTYFGLSVAVIAFCVAAGALLRAVLPGVYSFLTGGRGLA